MVGRRPNSESCSIGVPGNHVKRQGGVIGILMKWDRFMQRCLPTYSFRRLDEKESNKTLYPGLNFRFAKYNTVGGVEERTLYKAFGIRFDVMVFGQAGKFSFIHLIIYIGSTLSYYALVRDDAQSFDSYIYPPLLLIIVALAVKMNKNILGRQSSEDKNENVVTK